MDRAAAERAAEASARASRAAEERRAKLAAVLGPRYGPRRCSLESFEVRHAAQKPAVERLKAIRDRVGDFARSGAGLVLYGPVGTGKDHLLAALLYAAADAGLGCDWLSGQALYGRFRAAIDSGEREAALVERLKGPDVLALSDLIPPAWEAGRSQAWRCERLYEVLDARYRALKATWVTLNAASPEDADAKLSAPVFDRLQDGAELVPCFWPSHRQPRKT